MRGAPESSDDHPDKTDKLKTGRRRFLKGLAGTALLAAIGKNIDLLLPMTICRPGEWKGPITDHFDGTYFFNPSHHRQITTKPHQPTSLLSWFFRKRIRGEYPVVSRNEHTPDLAAEVTGKSWEITMVNHSTLLIRIAGKNILTDPIWSERTSPVPFAGPRRVRPVGIEWEHLPRIDVCVISHDHYDHFDAPTLKQLFERDTPLFIVPLGLKRALRQKSRGMTDKGAPTTKSCGNMWLE